MWRHFARSSQRLHETDVTAGRRENGRGFVRAMEHAPGWVEVDCRERQDTEEYA